MSNADKASPVQGTVGLLAPCPFCGSKNISDIEISMCCNDCGATGPDFDMSKTNRAARWNTRVISSAEAKTLTEFLRPPLDEEGLSNAEKQAADILDVMFTKPNASLSGAGHKS